MITRPAARPSKGPARARPSSSFLDKARQRGMLAALATFVGSGWLVYEIVHFILVDHYGLPEELKDIVIISVLGAMLTDLTRRWFRGERRAGRPKWEYVILPVIFAATGALDVSFILRLNGGVEGLSAAVVRPTSWENSVAVLPFVNISADPGQEYFCDGLTEEMITRLSQVDGLKVAARTSAFAFKGSGADIREIGRKLGVDKILEGSVRKEGRRLRVAAQLIDVSDGFHLWSETYDRDLDSLFSIQDDIALDVAASLKGAMVAPPGPGRPAPGLEAYNEFLLGQHAYASPSKENLQRAVDHYRKAVELDPAYARAWAALGAALAFQANIGFEPAAVNYPKAAAAVDTALALDERLAFAHSLKGWIRMTYDWDWAGAEAAYAKALRLAPGSGLLGASQLALALGRLKQATTLARRITALDALNGTAHMNLALTDFYCGRLKEAVKGFAEVLRISPDRANVRGLLAQVHLFQGLPELALSAAEKEADPFFRLPGQALAYHALGREAESYEALAKFIESYREGGAYQVAQVFAFRGEPNQAFEWLDIAYEQRDGGLFLLKVDPFFKPLRSDPRFTAFLKKVGLPLPHSP